MYELSQVSNTSYYLNSPAKIGLYHADETNVYLIDSGNDKDAGKKVLIGSTVCSYLSWLKDTGRLTAYSRTIGWYGRQYK